VQTGGPSGGALTYKDLDVKIDYESLIACQSMMGSGGMIVMDEDDCMVSIAKFFLDFTMDETCGKCTPCRIGSKRIYETLDKITKGLATDDDVDKLKLLAVNIKDTALCGLGQTMPNPVLSTMRVFEDEYRAHVRDKKCPAGVLRRSAGVRRGAREVRGLYPVRQGLPGELHQRQGEGSTCDRSGRLYQVRRLPRQV
jgi:NADP-reducing hydrogenase subunit HndC